MEIKVIELRGEVSEFKEIFGTPEFREMCGLRTIEVKPAENAPEESESETRTPGVSAADMEGLIDQAVEAMAEAGGTITREQARREMFGEPQSPAAPETEALHLDGPPPAAAPATDSPAPADLRARIGKLTQELIRAGKGAETAGLLRARFGVNSTREIPDGRLTEAVSLLEGLR